MTKINLSITTIRQAMKLYNLSKTAKSEVIAEKGQWRTVVVSALGFFSLCSLKSSDQLVVMSEDEAFIKRVESDPELAVN